MIKKMIFLCIALFCTSGLAYTDKVIESFRGQVFTLVSVEE